MGSHIKLVHALDPTREGYEVEEAMNKSSVYFKLMVKNKQHEKYIDTMKYLYNITVPLLCTH